MQALANSNETTARRERGDHAELLGALAELSGMVVLSGYPSGLYEERLAGWARIEKVAMADGAKRRVEVLWLNPAAAVHQAQMSLLEAAE